MDRAVRIVIMVAIVGGCGNAPVSDRARVLAAMPAEASAVFVADGSALGHPRFRPIVDALRPQWPASFGCVIDAALASRQVAAATTQAGTTIVITGRPLASTSAKCAALSKHGDSLWIATVGTGRVAGPDLPSVLDDPRFARARQHLMSAPIAMTLESARFRTIAHASAQPEPLEAWVAFDAESAVAGVLEVAVRKLVERMARDSTTSALAAHVRVVRNAAQIVARIDGAVDADLAAAARTLVTWGWGQTTAVQPVAWTCPTLITPVVGCTAGSRLEVSSLAAVADAIALSPFNPVVTNGVVSGLRVTADMPAFGLVRGDLVFACSGRPIITHDALVETIRSGENGQASIAVRRDGIDTKLVFVLAKSR